MSKSPSSVARKEDGPGPKASSNGPDEATNFEEYIHCGLLKDLDEAKKSWPYLTVDNRLPSMFNFEHDGFHQPFIRPTREVKRSERGQTFWQQQENKEF